MIITSEAGYELFEELVFLFSPASSRATCVFCYDFFSPICVDLGDELVDTVDH